MKTLRIALSKGSLLAPSITALSSAGLDVSPLENIGRQLLVGAGDVEYIIARPADVPTYVESGAVDVGFVGSDVLMEGKYQVYELLDFGFGRCKFVLAAPAGALANPANGRMTIATKYPKVAGDYLTARGRQAEIIKLYGSIELAPLVGLADQIIDLMSTGRTIVDNGLEVVEEIADVSCRLIANCVSYKLKSTRISELVERLRGNGRQEAGGRRQEAGVSSTKCQPNRRSL